MGVPRLRGCTPSAVPESADDSSGPLSAAQCEKRYPFHANVGALASLCSGTSLTAEATFFISLSLTFPLYLFLFLSLSLSVSLSPLHRTPPLGCSPLWLPCGALCPMRPSC